MHPTGAIFFFSSRRRHTRFDCDWSSDVCSSDLAVFLDALEADAERLDRVNLLLASLPPGGPAPDGLRPVELLLLHPTRDLADLAAGQGQLLPPRVRRIVRALGGQRDAASDFLGILLVRPIRTSRPVEA